MYQRVTEKHKWVRAVKSKPKALRHFKVDPVLKMMKLFTSRLNLFVLHSCKYQTIHCSKNRGNMIFCKTAIRCLWNGFSSRNGTRKHLYPWLKYFLYTNLDLSCRGGLKGFINNFPSISLLGSKHFWIFSHLLSDFVGSILILPSCVFF